VSIWPPTAPEASTGSAVSLAGIFPALERVPDFTNCGPLILISGFQTPGSGSASWVALG
jgi:hypothetical protein